MKRFLIVSKTEGVFLGRVGPIPLFSKDDTSGINKAYSFESKEVGLEFLNHFKVKTKSYELHEIETKNDYVDYVDLVKAGYGEYLDNMLFYAPSPSNVFN